MPYKTNAAKIALGAMLLASTSPRYAEAAARLHPGPWPIWHWHNHQPRQDQLEAMHKSDVTPEEAREIDRLYMQLEGDTQKNNENNKQKILTPRHQAR